MLSSYIEEHKLDMLGQSVDASESDGQNVHTGGSSGPVILDSSGADPSEVPDHIIDVNWAPTVEAPRKKPWSRYVRDVVGSYLRWARERL